MKTPPGSGPAEADHDINGCNLGTFGRGRDLCNQQLLCRRIRQAAFTFPVEMRVIVSVGVEIAFRPIHSHLLQQTRIAKCGTYRGPTGVAASVSNRTEGLDDLRDAVNAASDRLGRRLTFVMGKPGLDGHSNGAEQIVSRARDCGMAPFSDL